MMTEKELIGEIRRLRQIKPNKDWVVLTKNQILGQEEKYSNFVSIFRVLFSKPAYASLVFVFLLFGFFAISQNSLPGEILYPIKKITEKTQAVFVSENDKPKYTLEIASKRLEELNQIAQKNEVKKIAPAIQEFQANLSRAAENLSKTKNSDVLEIVSEIKRIKETKENIESSLATVIGESEMREIDSALLQLIEREIEDLEVTTLTDSQKEIFAKAVENFEAGNYSEALEKIWLLSNQQ